MPHHQRTSSCSDPAAKLAPSAKNEDLAWTTVAGSTRRAEVCKASPSSRGGSRVAEKPTEPRSKKAEASSRSRNSLPSVNCCSMRAVRLTWALASRVVKAIWINTGNRVSVDDLWLERSGQECGRHCRIYSTVDEQSPLDRATNSRRSCRSATGHGRIVLI